MLIKSVPSLVSELNQLLMFGSSTYGKLNLESECLGYTVSVNRLLRSRLR